ncbi:hypothetical protein TI39_contig4155g00008 [Zymoseptoria brevis]|uniref:J domain-containing protein n=1 Tax=Zymoseptoria brevis TaxID=1047168 RepID=A0A0F4GBR3_9PEZI|nr:hypothetical protein TI39_contig4155g00008 [Zymoseptoria brevis]
MDDPYTILEVDRDASDDAITQSYRRLALKVHLDKNKLRSATAEFQRLGQAYETLKDATKRRAYDLSHPLFTPGVSFSWTWNPTSTAFTGTFNFTTSSTYGTSTAPQQKPYHPPSAPRRGSDLSHDKAKIASIRKARNARNMNWHKSWRGFQDRIVQHKSDIQILKQQIKNLEAKRDAAEPLQAGEGFLERLEISSDSRRQEGIEKGKLEKKRTMQEKRLEQVIKEERLQVKQAELVREEEECKKKEQEFRDAEAADEIAIAALRERVKKEAARPLTLSYL